MFIKRFRKKILATVAASALTLSLTFGAPAQVEAANAADLIGAGIQIAGKATAMSAQVNNNIKHYNETEEGRQELYGSLQEKYGVNTDPTYNAMLDRIMANLTRGVAAVDPSINEKPYKYFVANQNSLNAACAMGHVMMVNAGTFRVLTNEDEIAAIVGHEMGHGQKDHVAKGQRKYIQKYITASVAGVAVGATVGGGALTSVLTGLAFNHSVAHGDRKLESEADTLGMDYMFHTNYNPGACAAVMQKFVEMSIGKKQSGMEKIFIPSDHPNSEKRRDDYVKKLFEYSGKHVTAKDGVVTVNKKTLITVAPSADMSSAERSYFVLGNLAVAYHKGLNKEAATVQNGIVMLGNQPIIQPIEGDEDAYAIAERLNAIK